MRQGVCGARFVRHLNRVHDLMAVNYHNNYEHSCYDCDTCENIRQVLHMFDNDDCDCERCDEWREDFLFEEFITVGEDTMNVSIDDE